MFGYTSSELLCKKFSSSDLIKLRASLDLKNEEKLLVRWNLKPDKFTCHVQWSWKIHKTNIVEG